MPIDRYHAFATGPTYAVLPVYTRARVTRIWKRLVDKLWHYSEQEQVHLAVESFLNGALVGPECRIGLRAWCVNPGPKDNIQLGRSVICRGLLRSEGFHPGQIVIGDHVYIGDDCILSCAERIDIGRLTLLAHGVQVFDNDSHPMDPYLREQDHLTVLGQRTGPRQSIASAPIWIGERAWVGFNAIVLKGVRIGDGGVVAAGSVVTSDVPPYTVVAGNPARVVKQLPMDRSPGGRQVIP